ncbi:hypothetical protein V7S43_017292 [Phytophthora oleae]|uniref:BZIP domain-containing protein n=1 Tax=Phytophthora oleae TaxID=2107226 RepID=A0ABD3ETS7_9STRA
MDRVSGIFKRFESTNSSRVLTSDVIGHVLPRASVGGGGVFSEPGAATIPPLRTSLPSISKARTSALGSPDAARPAPVAPQQTRLGCLMEASLARRMNDVAVCTSRSSSPVSYEVSKACMPVQPVVMDPMSPIASPAPVQPPLQQQNRAVPSVKTIRSAASGKPKVKRKRIRLKTPRRREQCRTNQARYRKKQMETEKTLEIAVEQLRHEVPMLELQHSRLVSNAKSSAWFAVVEYFHLFRNGARRPDQISSGPETWLQQSEAEQQRVFLRSSMAEDIALGEQRGINELVERWERYTSYFDGLQFQLEDMAKVSEGFVLANASLSVTISEATLQHVFPDLIARGGDKCSAVQEDKMAILRVKLLGQRLFLPCRLCFEWDEDTKRVIRMETTVDILSSLLHALGSIVDVVFVLERAVLGQDGTIG